MQVRVSKGADYRYIPRQRFAALPWNHYYYYYYYYYYLIFFIPNEVLLPGVTIIIYFCYPGTQFPWNEKNYAMLLLLLLLL